MVKTIQIPVWTNPDIVLFHGTIADYVPGILQGVNVTAGRNGCDFGQGFYTTTSERQARRWANFIAAKKNRSPAVIQFTVDRNQLAQLDFLAFIRKDQNATDFWTLVRHCRAGGQHSRTGIKKQYDVVIGPVVKQWHRRQVVFRDYDQFSFHTATGAVLLDQSKPKELK